MKTVPLPSVVKQRRGFHLHDKSFHGLALCLACPFNCFGDNGGKINGSKLSRGY